MLRSLKIKALGCVAKDTTSICLAERKRRSGASDHQKNKKNHGKKKGITRPRPDGGVKKQEKPQGALTPPLFFLPLGSKIYYGQVKVGDLSYLLRACDDNINQETTCLITLF